MAFLEDIAEVSNELSIAESPSLVSETDAPITFDLNPVLPQARKERLRTLQKRYEDCFSSSSKVRQTPLATHRIITDETARPVRQSPYRVCPRERDAIRRQVEEMLEDDIIQPSKIPWASPVVLVKMTTGD